MPITLRHFIEAWPPVGGMITEERSVRPPAASSQARHLGGGGGVSERDPVWVTDEGEIAEKGQKVLCEETSIGGGDGDEGGGSAWELAHDGCVPGMSAREEVEAGGRCAGSWLGACGRGVEAACRRIWSASSSVSRTAARAENWYCSRERESGRD